MALVMPCVAMANFRVIDASTNEPLIGAFVFDRQGKLLQLTGTDGVVKASADSVTISMMTYESQTVDAASQTADVALKPKGYELGEVVVNANDYFIKTSTVFRDVFRNDGKLVLYREGIADFYYDSKKKKYTRRVRACRQWVDPRLDKMFSFTLYPGPYRSIHLGKIKYVPRDGVTAVVGDTTYYAAKGGEKDAIINIVDSIKGIYRTIIDGMKAGSITDTPIITFHSNVSEWTFRGKEMAMSELVSNRFYTDFTYKNPMKLMKKMDVMMSSELAVTGICALTKDEAKAEMKNKKETREFTMPNVLPNLGVNLEVELQGLKPTHFDEY